MSPRLSVYLGKAKGAWLAHCCARGHKPSTAIKQLVLDELHLVAPARPTPLCEGQAECGPKARVELRLTASERAALQALAEREGCSPQTWIVNVVRAVLTRQPQVGMRELEALGESNYQLLAIGRNLNQIAKRLNERAPQEVTLQEISSLRRQIDAHTEVVAHALRASIDRWTLEAPAGESDEPHS